MKKFWLDNRGNAIPIVCIIMVVVAMLTAALAALGDTDMRILNASTKQQQAQYLARTGVEAAMQVYQKDVEIARLDDPTSAPILPMDSDIVYLKDDGAYTKDATEAGIVGQFQVNVQLTLREVNGVKIDEVQFTSEAVYAGTSARQTVGAYSTLNAYTNGWYDANGVVQKGKLLTREHILTMYDLGDVDFNPTLNGMSIVPTPATHESERLMAGVYPGYALYFPNINPPSSTNDQLNGSNKYLSIDRLHKANIATDGYHWPSSAVLFAAPLIIMDMPIDLRPSEADRRHPTNSSRMFYGEAAGDYVKVNFGYDVRRGSNERDKPCNIDAPNMVTGEATGAHNRTAYSATNLLTLDGADIVLGGEVRLYLRMQAYYYTNYLSLPDYPDGTERNSKLYMHMGELVLANNSANSYRYLQNGTLVKAPSGRAEYDAHPGLYKDANEYGKVYFGANVYLHVSANTDNEQGNSNMDEDDVQKVLSELDSYLPANETTTTTTMGNKANSSAIFTKGQTYLFRKEHTVDGEVYTGVDLLGWYITVSNDPAVVALRKALDLDGSSGSTLKFNEHSAEDMILLSAQSDVEQPPMAGLTQVVWE
jgi:hypothetical protein